MKPLYLLSFIILFSFSCKPASYTLQDYKGKKLTIANGGGFSGQLIEYIIFENGQVYRKNSLDKSIKEQTKLNREKVDQIFSNYTFLNLDLAKLNEPGNMYHYILMDTGDKKHKILWNHDISNTIDRNIKVFYTNVLNAVSKQ
jgi:hypothetical protein